MDTHFKKLCLSIFLLMVALVVSLSAQAQNSLHVSVLPPYTNRLADYANTPNKVVVIVTINGATTPNYSGKVFFRGKLRNASGDIEISTRPGFKPPAPVTIPTGPSGMPIPYTLTFSEIQSLFDWNNLDFKGISVDQIVQYGMAEDHYQFCIQTIDYVTNEVLIEERCGSPFPVALLEPPMIINPMNETTLFSMEPQSVLFNWTLSPGAPVTTCYTLRIVEMTEGVNPNEALLVKNYPMRFFESTITGPSFLYTSAHPKLEPDKTYAFAVIANDPVTHSVFRNNGMSEIHIMRMEGMRTTSLQFGDEPGESELTFLRPDATSNIAEINNKNGYALSWLWQELIDRGNVNDQIISEYCRNLDVEKYRLTLHQVYVTAPLPPTEVFTKDISMSYDSLSTLSHLFAISAQNAQEIGLISGQSYKASVTAIAAGNTEIATAESIPFVYHRLPDDNTMIANIHAAVDYQFEGRPGIYHATNVPVTIEAFMLPSTNNNNVASSNDITSVSGRVQEVNANTRLPLRKAFPFASITAYTNADGVLDVDFPLSIVHDSASVRFRLKTASKYYLDHNFSEVSAVIKGDTTRVSFGQQMAQVYGYSLKLYVEKTFLHKDTTGSGNKIRIHTDEIQDFPEGVTVALYRKNKADYIPPVEGNIDDYAQLTGFVEVARGKTQIEVLNGKKKAFVQFHNLLALPPVSFSSNYGGPLGAPITNTFSYNGEEYYIKALNSGENLNVSGASSTGNVGITRNAVTAVNTATAVNTGNTANIVSSGRLGNLETAGSLGVTKNTAATSKEGVTRSKLAHYDDFLKLLPFSNNGFIAEEMPYALFAPDQYDESMLYRDVTATYQIASTAPPTSRIKGSLSYKWHSDPNAVVRPMANVNFNIVVDYLVNGKLIGYEDQYKEYSFKYLNGNAINLYDRNTVAGSGKTNAQGNFIIDLANFNMKGDLQSGFLTEGYVSNPSTPSWQEGIGSSAPEDANLALLKATNLPITPTVLQRIFRIVPQSPYYYPSMDYFIVQPLANDSIPTQCSYVKEASISVTPRKPTRWEKNPNVALPDGYTGPGYYDGVYISDGYIKEGDILDQIKVLIFRDPSSRTEGMPIGEGEGEYRNNHQMKKLLNPQYKTSTLGGGDFTQQYGNAVFTKAFEWITEAKDGGGVTFTGLLPGFEDYYIEACSSPQEEGAINHYKASFVPIGQMIYKYYMENAIGNAGLFEDRDRWFGIKGPPEVPGLTILMTELESRILIRTIDNSSQAALPNVDIRMVADGTTYGGTNCFTDTDGYLQVRASQYPLNEMIDRAGGNNVSFDLIAKANGYKETPRQGLSVGLKGSQWVGTIDLKPAGLFSMIVHTLETDAALSSDLSTPGSIANLASIVGGNLVSLQAAGGALIALNANTPPAGTTGHTRAQAQTTGATAKKLGISEQATGPAGVQRYIEAITGWGSLSSFNTVDAYICIDSAPAIETTNGVIINKPIPAKLGVKIRVIPKDLAYFEETFTIETIGDMDYNFAAVLLRKKHRMEFFVKDKDTDAPIPGATMALGDVIRTTDSKGRVDFVFENVSVNNYTFVVRGPNSSSYIPVTVNIKNEESKEYITYNVPLEKGSTISGAVSFADNGQAVQNAKVYLDISEATSPLSGGMQMNTGTQFVTTGLQNIPLPPSPRYEQVNQDKALLTAYTDGEGKYTLRGVPANNCKIVVLATLDTSFTVVGDSKQASIVNKTASNVNFSLKKYEGMYINNLYGFPLTVESLTPQGDQSVKVSGLVEWGVGMSDFRVKDAYTQLRVEDVIFRAETIKGKQVGIAADARVELQNVLSLKLGYLDDKYNVLLTPQTSPFTLERLSIERSSDGRGMIKGAMQIVDNSFNYTASYLNFTSGNALDDVFFLATKKDGALSNIIETIISPLKESEVAVLELGADNNSNPHGVPYGGEDTKFAPQLGYVNPGVVPELYQQAAAARMEMFQQGIKRYYLSNRRGEPVKFKLLEFNAKAKPDSSYIADDGKIHLNVDLSCYIPNANPSQFSVNIKDMVLDNNKVEPATGSALDLKFGKWTLEVRNWRLDPAEGGLFSRDALLRTGVMDVPVGLFNLRHDAFVMDQFRFDNLLLGGGVASVKVDPLHGNGVLQWDNAVGTDMQGHWRLSVTSKTAGQAAATVTGLTGLTAVSGESNKLKISYVQVLDNNEATVTVASNQVFKVLNNDVARFRPHSLYNGSNYVNLTGILNILDAPRMPDIQLTLDYTKPGANVEMKPKDIELDFAPEGKVHFTAKTYGSKPNIRITSNSVEIDGAVSSKPDMSFNPMPTLLSAFPVGSIPAEMKKFNIDISDRMSGGAKRWTSHMTQGYGSIFSMPDMPDGSRLEDIKGGLSFDGSNWLPLEYAGDLMDNAKSKIGDAKDAVDGIRNTRLEVTVLGGGVTANSNALNLSNVKTPFGDLSLKYEFANSRLIGNVNAKDVILGAITINEGLVEFAFDPSGFYLAGGLKTFVNIPIIQGNYNVGFMAGYYKGHGTVDRIWSDYVQRYKSKELENICYLENIGHELKGFYLGLERVFFNTHLEYGFAGFGVDIRGYAGVGVDLYANFDPFIFGMGGKARLLVEGTLFDIGVAELRGRLDARAALDFVGTDRGIHFNANLTMDVQLALKALCLPLGGGCAVDVSETVHFQAKGGTGGFKFDFGRGNAPVLSCPTYRNH